MRQIVQLEQGLINKIAAGEVVERPLSVVKELTENAIDAGATIVTVEIADGGLTSIRVTDNGGGINASELSLAFSRHATSKIASLDDLFQVATLGFRGVALSSIASVAQVEMITKTPNAVMGTRIEIHGGKILSQKDIGCANGTTIVVDNLFYNTPARRKFLKKPATEAGYISDCLERLALANPSLTLKYINNGKIVFQSTGNGSLKTTMLNIYGRDVATKVVDVNSVLEDFCLSGLVGKPEIARGNRQHGSFFINGRYVQCRLLGRAVESAMKTMLPQGKFPLYALSFTLPYDMLDVNVHPTKMDVRFADEDMVFSFIENAVRDSLQCQNLIPAISAKPKPPAKEPEQIPLFMPDIAKEVEPLSETEIAKLYVQGPSVAKAFDSISTFLPPSKAVSAKENAKKSPQLDEKILQIEDPVQIPKSKMFTNYKILGLIFNTYWLVEQDNSLFLIDQHAAHERVLYEEILQKVHERNVPSQQLLVPMPLRLTPREKQTLTDNMEHFQNFGFSVDISGEEFALVAVPMLISGRLETKFFTELLDKIEQTGFSKGNLYEHKTELIAMASCKAAVKGGDSTTEAEAKTLVVRLMEQQNPFTCPHGRPTIIELTKQELERRFKRS